MKKTIHVALIGCGRIAGHHSRSIASIPAVKLAAVCDLDRSKAEAYGNEFSVPVYTNYRKMFQDLPEIDLVAVITPSGMHFEHTLEVLERYRKHVIVEKPTFLKPSHLKKAFEVARAHDRQIFPVFQNRHNLAVARVKEGLMNGELGKPRIVSIRVRWCRPQRYYDMAPWRGTYAMDGGALTNQGIHHIDLARFFGGEVKRVSSLMRTLGAQIEVEDTVVAHFEYESGAVGSIEITTSARPKDYEASLSIVGENGLAQIGGIAVNELQIYTPEESACKAQSEIFETVYGNGHKKMYGEIAQFFAEGKPFSVSQQDCLNTIRLLDSVYRSDEQKRTVEVFAEDESTRLGQPNEKLANLYRTEELT